tara:strand:- start:32 stop:262 length:231 start_codon:yes stop_codon:yes gene_type:complete
MSSSEWLVKFERELIRKNKARATLRAELDDKIEQLRILQDSIDKLIDDTLSTDQPSREDVEWDLLDERLNGGKENE